MLLDIPCRFEEVEHERGRLIDVLPRDALGGFLSRRKVEGVYQYLPVANKGDLFQRLLKGFVESAFGGSHAPLVAYFVEHGKLSREEMRMLRNVADRLDNPGE